MSVIADAAIADAAFRAGFRGPNLITAVAVALAESSGDTAAVGDVGLETALWGPSIGLWQIRSLNAEKGHGTDRDELANYDPLHNATAAYHISSGGSSFRPWSTYTNGAYTRYLDRARVAASGAGAGGTTATTGSPSGDYGVTLPPPPATDNLAPITSFEGAPVSAPDFPLVIRGRALDGNLDDYVVDGEVDLDIAQVWQISFTLEDPGLRVAGAGIFDIGTPVDAGEIHWQVAAINPTQGPAGEQLKITLRTAGAEKMKLDRGARSMTNASPRQYVAAEAADVGLTVVGGKTGGGLYAVRPTVGRNPANAQDPTSRAESAWEAVQRIAKEVGAACWEGGYGTLYFGSPRRFLQDNTGFIVQWRPPAELAHLAPLGMPDCRRTNDDPANLAEVTVNLPPSRGKQVRPGFRMSLVGVPGFEEAYLVSKVKWSLDRGATPVVVTAVTPRDPVPTDTAEQTNDPQAQKATPGTKSANDFVAFALRQAGKRYIYGGSFRDDDPDPANFDCSELAEWAAYQVGVTFRRPSGSQYSACKKAGTDITVDQAYATRGAVLFMGAGGSEHVAISLGDGQTTIEARGRAYGVLQVPNVASRGFTLAGLVPGMLYNGVVAEQVVEWKFGKAHVG